MTKLKISDKDREMIRHELWLLSMKLRHENRQYEPYIGNHIADACLNVNNNELARIRHLLEVIKL